MESMELEFLKVVNRLEKVEDCQTELRQRVDEVPSESELNQVQLRLAREAWELQKKEMPALIRDGIIAREKEREEDRAKTLAEMGMEIGPDGLARPKGGSARAFLRKNATTIVIVAIAIVIIRPDLILLVGRLILGLWGL
ncbi:MAG: hypothetical protein AAGA08_16830 [Pseudomonadota bacterium]